MERASSLIYPGSRTLAGWWRQLQPYQPTSVVVGYAHVHRAEALVQVRRSQPIDSFTQLVFQALSLDPPAGGGDDQGIHINELCQRMRLPAAVLQQFLIGMQKNGLLEFSTWSGWRATEAGRLACAARQYPVRVQERRTFTFLENPSPVGQRTGPPRYLAIADCTAAAVWHVEDTFRFDPAWIQACIAQSADWKRLHAFPEDIEALVQDASRPAWQQVIVDRPERLVMVLILASSPAPQWFGYAVRSDGWVLQDQAPIFRLPAAESSLTEEPATQVWQEAWQSWCRQRQLPTSEAENCALSYQPPRLNVRAPERLVQRLRAAKNDILKGDSWLIVGEGYLRTAALLALTSVNRDPKGSAD